MTTLAHILKEKYETCPDRAAVILMKSGEPDQTITYGDLVQGSLTVVGSLRDHGIQPNEVIVLILQHGSELIYSFFGAILHGAIPSIMPFLTEKLLPERYRAGLSSLVNITQPAAIMTYREFEPEVRAALKPGDSVRAVISDINPQAQANEDLSSLEGLCRSENAIVLLQHSSGTTGLQKGVALSHRAVLNQLDSYVHAINLQENDVVVSWLPLYHDMGLIAGFLLPILSGVPLVLMSPFDWVRAPYRLMQAVSQYHGTLTWLPNFAYNFCTQKIRPRHMQGVDLSSWRAVINCSEPMRWESHQQFLECFAPYGLKAGAMATCYAMAENVFAVTQGGINSTVTVDEVDRGELQTNMMAKPVTQGKPSIKMLSAGKPIENTKVRVLSPQGNALPERRVGEIALHSDCMLSEYYRRPDETQKVFLDGWYLTGDYGYVAEGEVYITGRKKDLIIVGGKNIYPQDLEELAMQAEGVHPGRVAAFGIEDIEAGTEEVVIVAEVDSGDEAERERIAEDVRERINHGSDVVVQRVHLVGKGWLVKTSSGKVSRSANREKYLSEIGGNKSGENLKIP
jgi:fatty-acyl-CoA synthase